MIVQCEKCESRFNLDESLLREEGSKVRCSQCRHVFLVRPPSAEEPEPESPSVLQEPAEETVILDSPPDLDAGSGGEKGRETSFSSGEEVFEPDEGLDAQGGIELETEINEQVAALEGSPEIEAISPEDLPDQEETAADMEGAFERASKIEERVTRNDADGKEKVEDLPETPARASKRGRRSILIPLIVGGLLLIGLLFAAVYILAPGMIPDAVNFSKAGEEQSSEDPGVKRLSFASVKGGFVKTEEGKQRFVVQGTIVNNYPGPRSLMQVKASILDQKGRTVRSRKAYAGNMFSQGELAGRPMTFLEKRMASPSAKERQDAAVPSGSEVPFMVVFQDLPDDISEFTVEAVGSRSAGRS